MVNPPEFCITSCITYLGRRCLGLTMAFGTSPCLTHSCPGTADLDIRFVAMRGQTNYTNVLSYFGAPDAAKHPARPTG